MGAARVFISCALLAAIAISSTHGHVLDSLGVQGPRRLVKRSLRNHYDCPPSMRPQPPAPLCPIPPGHQPAEPPSVRPPVDPTGRTPGKPGCAEPPGERPAEPPSVRPPVDPTGGTGPAEPPGAQPPSVRPPIDPTGGTGPAEPPAAAPPVRLPHIGAPYSCPPWVDDEGDCHIADITHDGGRCRAFYGDDIYSQWRSNYLRSVNTMILRTSPTAGRPCIPRRPGSK